MKRGAVHPLSAQKRRHLGYRQRHSTREVGSIIATILSELRNLG